MCDYRVWISICKQTLVINPSDFEFCSMKAFRHTMVSVLYLVQNQVLVHD